MTRRLYFEAILKFTAGVFLVAVLLFLPAGTVEYPGGWLLMGILFNALTLLGVDGSWQRFIRGFVMVVVIMSVKMLVFQCFFYSISLTAKIHQRFQNHITAYSVFTVKIYRLHNI